MTDGKWIIFTKRWWVCVVPSLIFGVFSVFVAILIIDKFKLLEGASNWEAGLILFGVLMVSGTLVEFILERAFLRKDRGEGREGSE